MDLRLSDLGSVSESRCDPRGLPGGRGLLLQKTLSSNTAGEGCSRSGFSDQITFAMNSSVFRWHQPWLDSRPRVICVAGKEPGYGAGKVGIVGASCWPACGLLSGLFF